ncbi:MAG: serine/threonine-protein kinase [Planctomycetota bacterium]
MDVRCDGCDTLYHLSPAHAGLGFQCDVCHHSLTVPAPSAASSGALFLVCAACEKGFSVPAEKEAPVVVCPHCGAEVDLCQGGETLVMQGAGEEEAGGEPEPLVEAAGAPAAPTPPPRKQRAIGGYHLEEHLARTPLGSIYRAEQVALRRQVAVYLLRPELARNPAGHEAFLANARKAAGLVHPGIARVYDVGAEGDAAYMVSEFVQGDTLEARMARSELLSFVEVGRIGAEACRALAAAHASRILHFGLAPANIALTRRGEARLLHFGITRALFAGNGGLPTTMETPVFAPEQLARGECDARTDLFALGVTLFAALVGSFPYTAEEIRRAAAGKTPPPAPALREMLPDAPQLLGRVLERLVALRPADRPAGANETAVEFESFARSGEAASTSSAPPLERPSKRRYKRFRTDMEVNVEPADLDESTRQAHFASLRDLSENGAFVATESPLPPGTFVHMEFALEGTTARVKALGLVRWVNPEGAQQGMGVQFLEVSTRNRRSLNRYVDSRAASETAQSLAVTALHKQVLRFLVRHWGEEVPIQRMMQGTGAGRTLFDRTIDDFQRSGLVEREGDRVRCLRPESDALNAAIDQLLQGSR